jgi:hypothetical protein
LISQKKIYRCASFDRIKFDKSCQGKATYL